MQKANALINEKSPYLLQHAYNPVNWMAWGDDAFQKAKSENKPIFLSIGYATCHWCHVMEHESFEDEQVAYLLNNYYVPIKVDREERPDVDSIYMTVTQMLSGHGGWPMTVILTPNLEPFFAGTYFPKFTRGGRVGLLELLQQIQGFWENEKDEVMASVNEIMQNLKRDFTKLPKSNFDINTLESAYNRLDANFDEFYGGFAQAPKFPMGHNILFLLRYYHRTKSENALNLINKTLIEMRLGGVYDQIGFGFHRYSTDERWLLPHFEKMLYDNALLLMAYSEANQLTSIHLYKATALEIAEFIMSEMHSENGSFYSAFDADSEGEEGKYYVWKIDEIKEILGADAQFFIDAFEFDEEGNFVHETGFSHSGDNIPFISDKNSIYFIEQNEEYINKINLLRAKLLEKRKTRIAPLLDDKVLTDWNGLMIAAMANAGKILGEGKLIESAQKAEIFVSEKLIIGEELFHRYRDNDTAINAMLDDYAYLILGLLNLYAATYQAEYLQKAISHCDIMVERFWDKENGGLFSTEAGKSDLIVRQKEAYDGAMPSGNSVAYIILQRLFRITANAKYIELAEKLSQAFSGLISKSPHSFAMMMCGLEYNQAETKDLVIVADTLAEAKSFISNRSNIYEPHLEIIVKTSANNIEAFAPHCKDLKMLNNKPTAYLCQNFSCSLPSNEI